MRWLALLSTQMFTALGQPLAAIISLQTLQNALTAVGYPAVTAFVMIESSGIPFPGETMLLLASFFAATNQTLQIPIVIASAALGAILGDNIGYTVGRTGGRALVLRYGKYVFIKQEHLDRAERFFARHGNKTVFLGRFVAVLRAWAALLAGVNHMQWRVFLIYNAAGGIIWAIIYGTLGFLAGRYFHDNFAQVEQIASTIGWTGAIIIVAAAIGLFVFFYLRRKRHAHRTAATSTIDANAGNATKATDTTEAADATNSIDVINAADTADATSATNGTDAAVPTMSSGDNVKE